MTGRQPRRTYLQTIGAAAVGLGAVGRASAAPDTVVVPDDQPTIQDGVDAVAPGGTVEVRASGGPYTGQVDVGKSVTLVGDAGGDDPGAGSDAPVVDGGGATRETGFKLYQHGASPDDVTIRGFVIRNFGVRPGGGEWGKGISSGADNERVTIEDCSFEDIGAVGVSVTTSGDRSYRDWTVERCRFENCPLAGVRFDHVSDATIRGNVFSNPSPVPDDHPHIGVSLHANTRNGASGTQSNVDVVDNEFRGDSHRSAVWLLAINKNDGDSDTLAALRTVRIAENTFSNMPQSAAIATAANSVRGAPTRLTDLEVSNNTVRGAHSGINLDSGAEEGVKT